MPADFLSFDSRSVLRHVEVSNGGVGSYKGMYNVTAAIETLGVPPRMEFIKVQNSAYNGKWTLAMYLTWITFTGV